MTSRPKSTGVRFAAVLPVLVLLGLVGWWVSSTRFDAPADPQRAAGDAAAGAVVPRETGAVERSPVSGTSDAATVGDAASTGRGSLHVRTITAADDAPLPGVGLRIESDDGTASAPRLVVSDERGEAAVDDLPNGLAHLISDRGVEVDCTIDAAKTTEVVIRIGAGIDVEGEVLDAAGAPLPHASIVVGTRGSTRFGQIVGRADAAGHFVVRDLPPRMVYVGAVHPEHFPSTMEPLPDEVPKVQPMYVVLRMRGPGAVVLGSVVGEDGAPIAEAEVRIGGTYGEAELRISRERFVGGWAPVVVRSDAHGEFRVDGLPTGPVEFLVHAGGGAPLSRMVELVASPINRVELRLAPGTTVRGRVVDEQQRALAGVQVRVRAFDPWQDVEAVTGSDGRFALWGCEPARLCVELRKAGYAAEHVDVVETAEPLSVVMRAERKLRGRLLDPRGGALAAWTVRPPVGRGVRSGSDGGFELIAEDEATLTVWPPGIFVAVAPVPEHDPRGLVLRVPAASMPTASLSGRLLADDDSAVPGTSVVLELEGEFAASKDPDPEDGSFLFEGLVPGEYALRISDRAGRVPPRVLAETVRVATAQRRDLGVIRAVPRPQPGRLHVEMRRRDGVPVEHARGEIFEEPSSRKLTTLLLSAQDGRVQSLLPGAYRLVFASTNASWAVRPFTIRSGEETLVELELEPATRRSMFLPWPMPADLPRSGAVHCAIFDAGGRLATEETFAAADLPTRFVPTLAVSAYRLELRCADGRRYQGRFRVDDLARSQEPIVVGVDAIR
ncbi:MAG: carboxypeptidase-like regulatory domain-containing protein [Planctomycetota bacterium]